MSLMKPAMLRHVALLLVLAAAHAWNDCAFPDVGYFVCRTGLEPQASRLKIDLPLTRASPALHSDGAGRATHPRGAGAG